MASQKLIANLLVASVLSCPQLAADSKIPDQILFNRDVRPIMSNTCFKCHGSDTKSNKAELRLDIASLAYETRKRKDGRSVTPIKPGEPDSSEAWRRILSTDPDETMPPPDNLHQLTDRDKSIIRRWIEQGAVYQSHWAYIPPSKAPLPKVANPSLARNAIDRFVLAQLDRQSIEPSPEADRRTLIRRLSLDLIGLPPTPEEVADFLADDAEDAYEKVVDRLLTSPHFGERMAVPWLDIVRFADTVGYHGDQGQNIFPYRDYVIDSFNQNKPFDTFTIEQIAGDLLENASPEQLTATGFNRLNMMTREGGAQPKEYLAKYAADRVRAVSTAWLGSTMGCAECHDHKFDPFTTKDFYSMAAFFADIKQYGVYSDYNYTPEKELIGWNNDFPFPPEIVVTSPYLIRRKSRLEQELARTVSQFARKTLEDETQRSAAQDWAAQIATFLQDNPSGWSTAALLETTSNHASTSMETLEDQSIFINETQSESSDTNKKQPKELLTIKLAPQVTTIATLQLEALPDVAHGGSIVRDDSFRMHANVTWAIKRQGKDALDEIKIRDAYANLTLENYFNGYLKASFDDEIKTSRHHKQKRHAFVYFPATPIELGPGDQIVAKILDSNVGRIRVSYSPLGMRIPDEKLNSKLLEAFLSDNRDLEQRSIVASAYVKSGSNCSDHYAQLLDLYREIAACHNGKAFTMVSVSTEPLTTRILGRGDWKDTTGAIVQPATPDFLSDDHETKDSRKTRLDLAKWIVDRDNPLTARAFVNRLWAQYFGNGLSAVLDDLGNQGEWPSHPELLDWLAVEFMESGWNVKAMARLIVTSGAYRQSSWIRPELRDIDPNNRLLARQNPRRLDAEFVRDNALSIAGLLNREIGGPSSHPYQPDGYYEPLNFPVRDYEPDTDDRQYRRGLYTHWQRTFLHPMLANFDAPGREECAAQRTVSNTPQQALTLLNDPTFVEAARVFAERILVARHDANFQERLEALFESALSREPTRQEIDSLGKFHQDRLDRYRQNTKDAIAFTSIGYSKPNETLDRAELAAMTSVARIILNLNETLVRY